MKFPCELIVWKVLPAIRARMAVELSKQGLNQKEIAGKLGLTEAAVSQYINKKRALDFKIDKTFDRDFKRIAKELSKSSDTIKALYESCLICKEIRKQGMICQIHRAGSNIPKGCDICFMGDKK